MSFLPTPCRRHRRAQSVTALPNNALALFFTVVEMGKLCLVQSLQFISRHVPPEKWSLLYSNMDNMIILLESAASLDEAILLAVRSAQL